MRRHIAIPALAAAAIALAAPQPAAAQEVKGRLTNFWATTNQSGFDGYTIKHPLSNITQSMEDKFVEIARGDVPTYAKLMEMPETEREDYRKVMDIWYGVAERIKGRGSAKFGKEQREFTGAPAFHDFVTKDGRISPKIKEVAAELYRKGREKGAEGGTDAKGRLADYWNKVDRSQLAPALYQRLSEITQGQEEAFEQLIKERIPSPADFKKMDNAKQQDYYAARVLLQYLHGHMARQVKERGFNAFGKAEKDVTGCTEMRKFTEKSGQILSKSQYISDEAKNIFNQ